MIQISRYHHNSTNQSIISRKPPHRHLSLVLSPSVYRLVKKRDPDPAQEHCPRPISKHLAGVKFKSQEASVSPMPHALSMPSPGFQAVILCGPGSSFPTFTANPDENPKALIPIANRPMVWYPIDFCYRMGITSKSTSFLYPLDVFAWL